MKQGIKPKTRPSTKQKIKPAYVYAAWTLGISAVIGLILFFYFGRFEFAFAGSTYTTTTSGGDWASGTTWSGGSSPSNWGANAAILNGNITLNSSTSAINDFSSITLNGGKSFTSGTSTTSNDLSFQNVTFTVNNGNIVVYGNLTLNNTSLTITTGSLTVTGTLTLTGNATLTSNSSGSINLGAFTSSGSGGTMNVNSGTLSIANSLTLNSSTTVKIASGVTASAASFTSSNNSDAILNNAGTLAITGDANEGGVINNTGTMVVGGNLISSGSGSAVFTNSGTLNISGDMTLPSSGKFNENPGGKATVNGNVNVGGNQNLTIGTNASPPPYADLTIKKNLVQSGSGDVLFDKNSRVAIFGNVTDSGAGGTLFTVNNGGEVYVNGNIGYSGGGNAITNNNTTSPYGLYVNGTTTNSGGGSSTTANEGNKTTLKNTNLPFYNWVASLAGSPLPITLINFKVNEVNASGIQLTWSTVSEENFDKFLIERSSDGKTFSMIGELAGAGNSKILLNYEYIDQTPGNGETYYRLKSVDLNGKFDYSPVVNVNLESQKEFSIYPNPSNGQSINFKTNFDPQEDDVIAVFDNSGAEITHSQAADLNGQINFSETLKPGIYIVRYSSASFKKAQRMVVQ